MVDNCIITIHKIFIVVMLYGNRCETSTFNQDNIVIRLLVEERVYNQNKVVLAGPGVLSDRRDSHAVICTNFPGKSLQLHTTPLSVIVLHQTANCRM